jgi:hypothetical protein
MERRDFLKGVFGGVTAAGVVIAAEPAVVSAFASAVEAQAPVHIGVPRGPFGLVGVGELLYNGRGEVVAVVKDVRAHRTHVDATVFGGSSVIYVPGPFHVEIVATAQGPAMMRVG